MWDWVTKAFGSKKSSEIAESEADFSASYCAPATGSPYRGGWGNSRGDGSKWTLGMSQSGSSPVFDHALLRQNARSAMAESMQARAIVERYADIVIDAGLKLECTPSANVLQITGEQAEQWSQTVEERFHLWASSKDVSTDGSMNFYQLQRLLEISQQRDGEYFARLHYVDDPKLSSALQIQIIDPNQINGYAFTSTHGYQFQQDGIERDAAGRAVKYRVMVRNMNNEYHETIIPAISSQSGLPMMLHGYQAEYAGQTRGYSRLAHAVQDFEKLTDFQLAHIQKAINHASINMYVKPSEDNDASDPFDTLPSQQFGATPHIPESAAAVDPSATLDLNDYIQYNDIPEAVMSRPGVGVFSLRSGEDLKPFQDTSPSEQYDRFVDAFTSYLSASMSIPIETVLMKFNENYSASRASLILFWRVSKIWQNELASDFLNPIVETWTSLEIAAGRITAPGWQDPVLRAAWMANNWIGAPMPDIDPLKHSKANLNYATLGATDLDRIARNLNGSVGATNRAKLTRQYDELPISPWEQKKGEQNG